MTAGHLRSARAAFASERAEVEAKLRTRGREPNPFNVARLMAGHALGACVVAGIWLAIRLAKSWIRWRQPSARVQNAATSVAAKGAELADAIPTKASE